MYSYQQRIFTASTRVLSTSRRLCINHNLTIRATQAIASSFCTAATTAFQQQHEYDGHKLHYQQTTSIRRISNSSRPCSYSSFTTFTGQDSNNNSNHSTSTSSLIPAHAAHKVCTASDAVSLISRGDTIA